MRHILFPAQRAFQALTCFLRRSPLSILPKRHHPQPPGEGVSQWSPPNHKFRNEFSEALCMTGQVSDGNNGGPDVGARGEAEVGCTESPDPGKRQRGLPRQENSSYSPV